MSDLLLCERDNRGVVTLRLNRPGKHNALNAELINALSEQIKKLHEDETVRVLVLSGEGKSFCSGADLSWMQEAVEFDEDANYEDAYSLAELLMALYEFNKPTIARINGDAYGGGIGLLASCDITIADENANFAFTEVRLGLIPAIISPYIVLSLGARQTQRLFMTAERFNVQQAVDYGLIQHCVNAESLDKYVEINIASLLKAGPKALSETKELLHKLTPLAHHEELARCIARIRVSDEGQAGLRAFLSKTSPPWRA